jgi:protein SCO1
MDATTPTSMPRRRWLRTGMAGAGAALGLAAAQRPAWPGQDAQQARETIRRHSFPDLPLVTHQGREVRFYTDLVAGKLVTINFFYIGCADGTCPITTHNLALVQQLLKDRVGRDLFMVSITLNPEFDTPAALKAYATKFGALPGWEFLTGRPQHVHALRRALGFYDRDPKRDADLANHAGMVRYGNEPRQLWGMTAALARPDLVARAILSVDGPAKDTGTRSPASSSTGAAS